MQRHHSHSNTLSLEAALREPPWFCILVCDEIIVTLSSTVLLAHAGLTTWTWSQMHSVQFLFHSHCSLATSCRIICTDMAALHQLHDEELWTAYSNTNVFVSAAMYWHILHNAEISPPIRMLRWDVCRCSSKLPGWPWEISDSWTHIAGCSLQNNRCWTVKFFFSTWKKSPVKKFHHVFTSTLHQNGFKTKNPLAHNICTQKQVFGS